MFSATCSTCSVASKRPASSRPYANAASEASLKSVATRMFFSVIITTSPSTSATGAEVERHRQDERRRNAVQNERRVSPLFQCRDRLAIEQRMARSQHLDGLDASRRVHHGLEDRKSTRLNSSHSQNSD